MNICQQPKSVDRVERKLTEHWPPENNSPGRALPRLGWPGRLFVLEVLLSGKSGWLAKPSKEPDERPERLGSSLVPALQSSPGEIFFRFKSFPFKYKLFTTNKGTPT